MVRHVAVLLAPSVVLGLLLGGCQAGSGSDGAAAVGQDAQRAATTSRTASAPAEGVTVTGRGRAAGEPDALRATVGVHVVRPTVERAFADAASTAEQVLAALQERGVAEEDIQTRELSVRPEQQHRPDGPPATTGYVVRNLVEVSIREVDDAGALLAAVVDAAGDDARVEDLRFVLERDDALLEVAREEAFADARAKAEHYAALAELRLGALVTLTETSADGSPPVPMPAAAESATAPLAPGQQERTVQVQATWELR